MDATPGTTPTRGGTVEPANRAAVARQVHQMPSEPAGTRYELRDPFAEVTYRVDSFAEMTAKADRLGATKFVQVTNDGTRTAITKTGGVWEQPPWSAGQKTAREAEENRAKAAATTVAPRATASTIAETALAKIDTDAERKARVAHLEAALFERYVVKRALLKVGDLSVGQTEYRYRGDANRVAFTETTFRLASDNNNPSVIRSMVDVAEARNWQGVRVSGSEDFKRLVWLEASLRGVKALGYEPQLVDQDLLKREREARARNRVEPLRIAGTESRSDVASDGAGKDSARGGSGRKAVLAALQAVLVAKGVPERQRVAVLNAAEEQLAKRLRAGQVHKVQVFDKTAPANRSRVIPPREISRSPERPSPAR